MALVSVICASPSAAMISAAGFPVSNIVANTFFPLAAVISPFSTFASSSASAAGFTGQSAISFAASFSRRNSSTEIQLAADFAGAPAMHSMLRNNPQAHCVSVSTPASYAEMPYAVWKRATLSLGQFRHRPPHFRNRAFRNRDGQQIRIGEITVIVREFLRAHRLRAACRHVPEPRFLRHRAAGFQHADLPLDFVFQRMRQIAERVQVLHFRLRAEFRWRRAAARSRSHRSAATPLPCCSRSLPYIRGSASAP